MIKKSVLGIISGLMVLINFSVHLQAEAAVDYAMAMQAVQNLEKENTKLQKQTDTLTERNKKLTEAREKNNDLRKRIESMLAKLEAEDKEFRDYMRIAVDENSILQAREASLDNSSKQSRLQKKRNSLKSVISDMDTEIRVNQKKITNNESVIAANGEKIKKWQAGLEKLEDKKRLLMDRIQNYQQMKKDAQSLIDEKIAQ